MPPPGSQSAAASFSNSSRGPSNFQFNPRDADDIFAELFGSTPFGFESMGRGKSTGFQTGGGGHFSGFGGNEGVHRMHAEGASSASGGQPRKPPPVETKLPCSLEELYNGTTKKMKISRTVLRPNGYLLFHILKSLDFCRILNSLKKRRSAVLFAMDKCS